MAAVTSGRQAGEGESDGKPLRKIEKIEKLGLVVGALLLLYFAFHVFAFVLDDAFITYRYAWHLRHGYGPVFNPGEHVEGYSCSLFMTLTALLMYLPGDMLFRAKLLGLIFALATLWAIWRLARELRLPPSICAAAPLLLGANASFALSAIDGMETSLQAMLVTLATLQIVREQRTGSGWLSALLLLAVGLNRTEGAIYFVAALAPYASGIRRYGFQRRDLLWILTFVVPFVLFLLWRHWYYGDWLPNTVRAKSIPIVSALDYRMGPAYLLTTIFMVLNKRLVPVSVVLWLIAIRGGISLSMRRGGLMVCLGVGMQALVALCSGGDWMPGWRYMTAAVPLWILCIACGLQQIVIMPGRKDKPGIRLLQIGYTVLVLVFIGAGWEYRDIEWKYTSHGPHSVSWAGVRWTTDARKMLLGQTTMHLFLKVSDDLNRLLPSGASVAFSEMGAIPYYTLKLHWLDTDGLMDREIARLETATHGNVGIITRDFTAPATPVGQALLRRRPDYVMLLHADDYPYVPILHGAYLPLFRIPLDMRLGDKWGYLLIWKRRPGFWRSEITN